MFCLEQSRTVTSLFTAVLLPSQTKIRRDTLIFLPGHCGSLSWAHGVWGWALSTLHLWAKPHEAWFLGPAAQPVGFWSWRERQLLKAPCSSVHPLLRGAKGMVLACVVGTCQLWYLKFPPWMWFSPSLISDLIHKLTWQFLSLLSSN